MIPSVGETEILILLVIVMLLFEARRILRKGVLGKDEQKEEVRNDKRDGELPIVEEGHDKVAGDENARFGRAEQEL